MSIPLYEQMLEAYLNDDKSEALHLIDGYKPHQLRALYRAIREYFGYDTMALTRRGEYNAMADFFGAC